MLSFLAKASYQLSAVVKFYPSTQEPNSLTVLQQKRYLQTRWDASVQIYKLRITSSNADEPFRHTRAL